jgi:cyanoexosortase B-associated protein
LQILLMISFSKLLKENQFPQLAALLLLVILLVIGAVPGYITGHWQWEKLPPITTIKQLRQLRHQGLNLPGWQTIEKSQQQIGGHKWLMQINKKQGTQTQAILLLLPQTDSKNQPEVEWTEIQSWQQWNVAQYRPAEFTVKLASTQVKVEAQFFRASTMKQTFAVLQWYAFPQWWKSITFTVVYGRSISTVTQAACSLGWRQHYDSDGTFGASRNNLVFNQVYWRNSPRGINGGVFIKGALRKNERVFLTQRDAEESAEVNQSAGSVSVPSN